MVSSMKNHEIPLFVDGLPMYSWPHRRPATPQGSPDVYGHFLGRHLLKVQWKIAGFIGEQVWLNWELHLE